jgi:bifunctional DNA-binding transcriptional regulator/antitoxin component of YhaV-PrlF toxin-antitoxin module
MSTKYTACLVHELDKERIKELRKKLNLTEKDTLTMIITHAENHLDEMIAEAEEKNNEEKNNKEARRKEKYEEQKAAMKEARKLVAAGKVKKSDKKAAITNDEPSID